MKSSKFLKKMLTFLPNKHSYMEGYQHQMERQIKPAECTTFVFILQTEEAAKKWQITEEAVKKIEEYFSQV